MSVNEDTGWQKVTECLLDGVMSEIITRFLEIGVKFGMWDVGCGGDFWFGNSTPKRRSGR